MKKKILALCMCVCMLAVAVVSGTLAYFQDVDVDVNVMTAGNVTIVQNETDRNGAAWGTETGKALYPAVYYDATGTKVVEGMSQLAYDGTMNNTDTVAKGTINIWDKTVRNEIDKVISVTNTGTIPAYIRTIVLMENNETNAICEKVHGLWYNDKGQYRVWVMNGDKEEQVTINGVTYSIAVCTYNTALAAGETSSPSLMQLFLDPSTENDWYNMVGNDFNIIAISQAVQTAGFDDATTALNAAFGEVNAGTVMKWINKVPKTDGKDNTIQAVAPNA